MPHTTDAPDDGSADRADLGAGPETELVIPRARPRRLAVEAAAVAAFALAWAAWLLRIWRAPLRLPLDTSSDATLISSMVKTISERGWYLNQPRLGAPYGQQFYDFPHGGESIQLGAIKVLVLLTGDWGLAINLYFCLGFGLLSAVTFLVLRHLRFAVVPAAIAALIYTFLPYHFTHGEGHLWRSAYYSAPLAALLLVWATQWRERFLTNPGATGRGSIRGNLRRPRVAGAVVVAMIIGGTETMTTGFTMSLLASGAVVAAVRWREPSRLVVAVLLVAVMGGTFAVLSLPTLNYYRVHGTNDEAARRAVTESEVYGLKLSRLVTPQAGHRSQVLSDLGARAQEATPVRSEGGQALGFLGTAGFVGAIYGALAGRRLRTGPDVRPGWDRRSLREQASVFTLLAVLFGTIGGLSVLLALAGFSQIRVWNRIMLIIAFFAMVVMLLWAEQLVAWIRHRWNRPRPILAGLAVMVLAFGLWDGIPPARNRYPVIEAQHAKDRQFVGQVEDVMPDGAAILQLPIIEFPESGPLGCMKDYDHLRAYLADDGSLEWSYGSVKGRPAAAWQVVLRDEVGTVRALPAVLGLGFTGIWVDTCGYRDKPGPNAATRAIESATGVAPLVSADGRFLFFDLRDFKARSGLDESELDAAVRDLLHVEPPRAP